MAPPQRNAVGQARAAEGRNNAAGRNNTGQRNNAGARNNAGGRNNAGARNNAGERNNAGQRINAVGDGIRSGVIRIRRRLGGIKIMRAKTPDFRSQAGVTIGVIQVIGGVLSVALSAWVVKLHHWDIIGYPSVGVWAGVLFYLPAGLLGIATMRRNTCMIKLYMTWCIFAAFAGPLMTVYEGLVAGVGSLVFACKSILGPLFDSINSIRIPLVGGFNLSEDSICENFGVEEAVYTHGALALIGLIECIVSIVGSAFCCGGLCCGRPKVHPVVV